jgi:hypothetical protein
MSGRTGTVEAVLRPGRAAAEHGSGAGSASNPKQGQEARTIDAWPLKSYLELGALPSAVPCARLHAKQLVWEWKLEDLAETVELVVSELATNAQRASAGLTGSRFDGQWSPGVPPIRLWLCSDKQRVLIQVWDGDHHLPQRQDGDFDAESGRGLLLVDSLSEEWGAHTPEQSSGKVVWAVLSREYTCLCAEGRVSDPG